MHIKTMEGLAGANTSHNLLKVPFRVFKEARRRGDMATMERTMDYASDFAGKTKEYQAEADEGMKEDAKEVKEREKLELEKAIEKRKEDGEKLEENAEGNTEPKADTLEISEEGKAFFKNQAIQEQPEPFGDKSGPDKEPALYSKTGTTEPAGMIGGKISITV